MGAVKQFPKPAAYKKKRQPLKKSFISKIKKLEQKIQQAHPFLQAKQIEKKAKELAKAEERLKKTKACKKAKKSKSESSSDGETNFVKRKNGSQKQSISEKKTVPKQKKPPNKFHSTVLGILKKNDLEGDELQKKSVSFQEEIEVRYRSESEFSSQEMDKTSTKSIFKNDEFKIPVNKKCTWSYKTYGKKLALSKKKPILPIANIFKNILPVKHIKMEPIEMSDTYDGSNISDDDNNNSSLETDWTSPPDNANLNQSYELFNEPENIEKCHNSSPDLFANNSQVNRDSSKKQNKISDFAKQHFIPKVIKQEYLDDCNSSDSENYAFLMSRMPTEKSDFLDTRSKSSVDSEQEPVDKRTENDFYEGTPDLFGTQKASENCDAISINNLYQGDAQINHQSSPPLFNPTPDLLTNISIKQEYISDNSFEIPETPCSPIVQKDDNKKIIKTDKQIIDLSINNTEGSILSGIVLFDDLLPGNNEKIKKSGNVKNKNKLSKSKKKTVKKQMKGSKKKCNKKNQKDSKCEQKATNKLNNAVNILNESQNSYEITSQNSWECMKNINIETSSQYNLRKRKKCLAQSTMENFEDNKENEMLNDKLDINEKVTKSPDGMNQNSIKKQILTTKNEDDSNNPKTTPVRVNSEKSEQKECSSLKNDSTKELRGLNRNCEKVIEKPVNKVGNEDREEKNEMNAKNKLSPNKKQKNRISEKNIEFNNNSVKMHLNIPTKETSSSSDNESDNVKLNSSKSRKSNAKRNNAVKKGRKLKTPFLDAKNKNKFKNNILPSYLQYPTVVNHFYGLNYTNKKDYTRKSFSSDTSVENSDQITDSSLNDFMDTYKKDNVKSTNKSKQIFTKPVEEKLIESKNTNITSSDANLYNFKPKETNHLRNNYNLFKHNYSPILPLNSPNLIPELQNNAKNDKFVISKDANSFEANRSVLGPTTLKEFKINNECVNMNKNSIVGNGLNPDMAFVKSPDKNMKDKFLDKDIKDKSPICESTIKKLLGSFKNSESTNPSGNNTSITNGKDMKKLLQDNTSDSEEIADEILMLNFRKLLKEAYLNKVLKNHETFKRQKEYIYDFENEDQQTDNVVNNTLNKKQNKIIDKNSLKNKETTREIFSSNLTSSSKESISNNADKRKLDLQYTSKPTILLSKQPKTYLSSSNYNDSKDSNHDSVELSHTSLSSSLDNNVGSPNGTSSSSDSSKQNLEFSSEVFSKNLPKSYTSKNCNANECYNFNPSGAKLLKKKNDYLNRCSINEKTFEPVQLLRENRKHKLNMKAPITSKKNKTVMIYSPLRDIQNSMPISQANKPLLSNVINQMKNCMTKSNENDKTAENKISFEEYNNMRQNKQNSPIYKAVVVKEQKITKCQTVCTNYPVSNSSKFSQESLMPNDYFNHSFAGQKNYLKECRSNFGGSGSSKIYPYEKPSLFSPNNYVQRRILMTEDFGSQKNNFPENVSSDNNDFISEYPHELDTSLPEISEDDQIFSKDESRKSSVTFDSNPAKNKFEYKFVIFNEKPSPQNHGISDMMAKTKKTKTNMNFAKYNA